MSTQNCAMCEGNLPKPSCPSCFTPDLKFSKISRILKNMISEFSFQCDICGQIMKEQAYVGHQNECGKSSHLTCPNTNCLEVFTDFKNLHIHLDACQHRTVECIMCRNFVCTLSEAREHHCFKSYVYCQNNQINPKVQIDMRNEQIRQNIMKK